MQKKRRKSKKQNKKEEPMNKQGYDNDENFAMIIGYTSGGAPYGVTHEEMEKIEKSEDPDGVCDEDNGLPFWEGIGGGGFA